LGHAKRQSVFASTFQVAPRCEAAGKPRKAGQPGLHPSLTSTVHRTPQVSGAIARALRWQYPRSADHENLPLVLN
tara:strand:- start:24496 stop:24720 length:225 start_codon:yes stop_codon:yes gene_type:complete